jgi:TonB dependent receptor.
MELRQAAKYMVMVQLPNFKTISAWMELKYMPLIRIGAMWFIALPWCRITVRHFQRALTMVPSR